jgi:hypothetical protein
MFTLAAVLPVSADEQFAPSAGGVVPLLASAPASSTFTHRRAKAPADEYFGQLKLSILGVRNVVADIDTRADAADDGAARAMCHKLIFAEDALRDWQAKYPDDTWIPKLGYAMVHDFEKIDSVIVADDSNVAGTHAIDLQTWLDQAYPNSVYAPK